MIELGWIFMLGLLLCNDLRVCRKFTISSACLIGAIFTLALGFWLGASVWLDIFALVFLFLYFRKRASAN